MYGETPPESEEGVERVDDWPASIVVGLTETSRVPGIMATLIVDAFEVTVDGDPELSVTCSSKDHVPFVASTPVEIVTGETQDEELPRSLYPLALGPSWSHWHVYGEVPPLKVAESVDDWPISIVGGVPDTVFTTSAGLTVTVRGDVVRNVTAETALSVTEAQ